MGRMEQLKWLDQRQEWMATKQKEMNQELEWTDQRLEVS